MFFGIKIRGIEMNFGWEKDVVQFDMRNCEFEQIKNENCRLINKTIEK